MSSQLYNPVLAAMFVSPAFFFTGLGLVAVPIIIHILNRRRYKIVPWAAMEFLLRAMKKNRRRLRFEQLLLLATRCLIMLLAGLALARPLGCQQSMLAELTGQRSGLHVFVIDNSYSLAYEADRPNAKTHLDQAKLIAKAMIERLQAGGESVAIVTAGRPATAVVATPMYDLKKAEAEIDRIEQAYTGHDLLSALNLARDIATAETKQPEKSIYLLDDSPRSEYEHAGDGLKTAGKALTALFTGGVTHFNLAKPNEWNNAVTALSPTTSLVTNWFPTDVVSRVAGYGSVATNPRLIWKLDDTILPGGGATVIPTDQDGGTPQTQRLENLKGGQHVLTATLQSDDRLTLDNTRYRVCDVVSQMKMLIVEGERGTGGMGSSGAFLEEALNPTVTGGDLAHKTNSYIATETISDLDLPGKVLGNYRCIALCGVGQINELLATQLEQYVNSGGTLMLFMGDRVTAEAYNTTLGKHRLLPGPLTKRVFIGGTDAPRHFDFNPRGMVDPILGFFQGQENTGLNEAEIYSYWQVQIPEKAEVRRVLDFRPPDDAKDAPRDPAITVHQVGDGRVVFYATSADPNSEWTTFMAHLAYPELMHSLVLGTVSSGDNWMNITCGDPLVVPANVPMSSWPTLTDEKQAEYPLLPDKNAAGQTVYRSKPLPHPGIYTLSSKDAVVKIAVNIDATASDVRSIDDAGVKKALGDIAIRLQADQVPEAMVAEDTGKELGWGVMLAVLILLGAESFMAMWFGHHRHRKPVVGPATA